MDYTVGSIADLISGKQTPNKPKVISKIISESSISPNEDGGSSLGLKKKRKAEHDASNKSSPHKKIKRVTQEQPLTVIDYKVADKLNEIEKPSNDENLSRKSPGLKKKRKAEHDIKLASKSSPRKKIKRVTQDQSSLADKVADKLNGRAKQGVEKAINNDIDQGNAAETLLKAEIDLKTIFVGNVEVSVTKKQLLKLFRKYGKIESIRLRSIAPARPGISKRLAAIKRIYHDKRTTIHSYIQFAKQEEALKATELNTSEYKGHHLRVELCGGTEKPDEKKAIFVGNLPFDVEDDDLWSAFEPCGQIKSVRIVRNNGTGMGIGIGYVNFESSDSVELALQMDDVTIKKRVIRVQRCGEKNKKKLKQKKNTPGSYTSDSKNAKSSNQPNQQIVKHKKSHTKPNLQKMEKKQGPGVIDKSAFQGSKSIKKKKKPKQNKGVLNKMKLSQKIAPRLKK